MYTSISLLVNVCLVHFCLFITSRWPLSTLLAWLSSSLWAFYRFGSSAHPVSKLLVYDIFSLQARSTVRARPESKYEAHHWFRHEVYSWFKGHHWGKRPWGYYSPQFLSILTEPNSFVWRGAMKCGAFVIWKDWWGWKLFSHGGVWAPLGIRHLFTGTVYVSYKGGGGWPYSSNTVRGRTLKA